MWNDKDRLDNLKTRLKMAQSQTVWTEWESRARESAIRFLTAEINKMENK